MTFLHMTKKYDNHFGIHTNGVWLKQLEEIQGWLTELNRISTDRVDYLSVALDAGFPWSWGRTKGTKQIHKFNDIIEGLRQAVKIRDKNNGEGHAIRLCYLISPVSGTKENFGSIVNIVKDIGLDSLRFSIPFACYNQTFDEVRGYKRDIEIPGNIKYEELLQEYLSESQDERPYIFYTGPEFTDIDKYVFDQCVYGYYQITYGADGYVYKCSTTATPTASHCRVGKVTADLDEFNKMVVANQNPSWNCRQNCFKKKLRCNRMGVECNILYSGRKLLD